DASGGQQASGDPGSGQSRRHPAARTGEVALPQSRANPRDRRALDRKIRTLTPAGAERHEKSIGSRRSVMSRPKFVYVTFIRTTPQKLWWALTDPDFTKQYWFEVHH